MSFQRELYSIHQQIAHVLAWLRLYVQPGAELFTDTRLLKMGDVFVAYAVEGADNRPFINIAIECGAAAVLYQPEQFDRRVEASIALAVTELDKLVGEIASSWYGNPSDTMLMVGVTGTNGKTSCSHWVADALTSLGKPCAIIGTLGNGMLGQLVHTGFTTPNAPQLQRDLAQLRISGAQAVAMEISSHALHQGRVNGTALDIAIFTNLTQDHLDYHGTFEAYEAAKACLFAYPGLRYAVINCDDEAGRRFIAMTRGRVYTIAYSIGQHISASTVNAWLIASNVCATAMGTTFHLSTSEWGDADVSIMTLGSFNVSNQLGVLGALLAADVPFTVALSALAKLQPINGRMQQLGGRIEYDEPLVVIDYAHTPDALEKTLEALRPIAAARGGKLICMFGCGGDRDIDKRPLMGIIAERLADNVVITSDNPRSENPLTIINQIILGMRVTAQVCCIEDRARAILQTIYSASRESVIVLAGKGHEMTQEIMGKKHIFSDQDYARFALAVRATQVGGERKG